MNLSENTFIKLNQFTLMRLHILCLLIPFIAFAESSALKELNANNGHGLWLDQNLSIQLTDPFSHLPGSHSTGLVGCYYQNRFRFGIAASLYGENTTCALFWQWRANKEKPGVHPGWSNTYQIGLTMNFAI